ncbi:MAG: tripartite tricarboxylate transporter substrate binding protein [Variovorax sp.]|nr:tripartite tricarboxylate transporter substrate binding protein [Variovorax sp.]
MWKLTKRAFLGSVLACAAASAFSADFPDHPLKLVIPYAPGGPTDVLGRLVAEHMGRVLNQPVVVENKAGAAGLIAMGQVAKARADGYTLLLGDMNLAVAPAMNKNLGFDPARDFTPIGMIATAPMLMLVPADSPAKTAQELIALAKGGKLAYASAGVGSPTHLASEVFKARYGLEITHVPYQGAGPALTAVAAGQTALIFTGLSGARPLIEAGKLRPLAITGDQRSPVLPNVPTLKEAGLDLPELKIGSWWGLLAPAGLPAPVARQLEKALVAAMESPEAKSRLAALNYTQAPADTDFSRWVGREAQTWTAVMQKAGIRPE